MFERYKVYEITMLEANGEDLDEVTYHNCELVEEELPVVKFKGFDGRIAVLNVSSPRFVKAVEQKD